MNLLGFIILTTALSFAVIFISFYASFLNRQLKRLNGHLSAYKQNLENHRRVHSLLASERDAKENLANELQARNAELKQDISRLQGEIEAVHLSYKPKRGKDGKFVRKTSNKAAIIEPIEQKETRDWSVPQAFPVCYKVPKGVQVVVIEDGRSILSSDYRNPGLKGVTSESDDVPFCDWEDGKKQICMESFELAPVNPEDHPDHPQFKGKK